MATSLLTLRVRTEDQRRLREAARTLGTSVSYQVRVAISSHLSADERQLRLEEALSGPSSTT